MAVSYHLKYETTGHVIRTGVSINSLPSVLKIKLNSACDNSENGLYSSKGVVK